uniref:Uncharacterized protein n=1 Tax=Zea mays TaxID=4577 RepID=A0A804M9N7_MAIZE
MSTAITPNHRTVDRNNDVFNVMKLGSCNDATRPTNRTATTLQRHQPSSLRNSDLKASTCFRRSMDTDACTPSPSLPRTSASCPSWFILMGSRVLHHLLHRALHRRRRGRQRALAVELPRGQPREASAQARAEVVRSGGRVEPVAGVGEEEEEHVLVRRETPAADEARPGERDDGHEAGRGAAQLRAVGFAEAYDALLQLLHVLGVQGERPAGEPQAVFLHNRGHASLEWRREEKEKIMLGNQNNQV